MIPQCVTAGPRPAAETHCGCRGAGRVPIPAPRPLHAPTRRRQEPASGAKLLLSALLPPLLSVAVAGPLHAAEAALPAAGYVPSPVEPGWEIWVGAAAGVFPFLIATWEFSKRIIIQRRCPSCRGSGLISNSRGRLVKCKECGGLLPWLGWKQFFFSTATPGNGGPLLQPRGQTSVFYRVPPPPNPQQQRQEQQQQQQQGVVGPQPAAGEGQGSAAVGAEAAGADRGAQ